MSITELCINLKVARDAGLHSIPELQAILKIAEDGECNPANIAASADISRAVVSGIAERLEGLKLIQRRHSSSDRRFVFLRLTEKGRKITENLKATVVADLGLRMSR